LFCCAGASAHDHEEGLAFLSLSDHIVSFFVPFLNDGVGKL